jgi:hypothetical protein
MGVDFLEQNFILLEVASTCMKTYDAHEDILVVGQVCNGLEILDVGLLVKTCIYSVHDSIYCNILVYTSTYLCQWGSMPASIEISIKLMVCLGLGSWHE